MKGIFDEKDCKIALLAEMNEKQQVYINDLEDRLSQNKQQIQVMEESRDEGQSDFIDVKKNLNQQCLEIMSCSFS
jgi:uncharacterized protein (DUF1499 family)